MTPEIELAKMLGELPKKDKLASALEKLPIEQLEEILRAELVVEKQPDDLSHEEKTAMADSWGRELARENVEEVKTAAQEELVDPGWWQAQKGMYRAVRKGDTGIDRMLVRDDLASSRLRGMLSGGGIGGAVGAGLGTAAGALLSRAIPHRLPLRSGMAGGALLGAGLGANTGMSIGQHRVDTEHFRREGIVPRYGGLTGATFTPSAAKKYLDKPAKKSKGKEKKSAPRNIFSAGFDAMKKQYRENSKAQERSQKAEDAAQRKGVDPEKASAKAYYKTSSDRRYEATAEIVKKANIGMAIQKGVGHAAGAMMRSPLATRAAVGAGIGAVGGAAASPENRLGGALAGAGVGAAGGALARKAVGHVGSQANAAGKYLRVGLADAGHPRQSLALHRMSRMRAAGRGMPGQPVPLTSPGLAAK